MQLIATTKTRAASVDRLFSLQKKERTTLLARKSPFRVRGRLQPSANSGRVRGQMKQVPQGEA
jgi:hypothetical protein